jgi:hypothetical protein
MASKTEPKISKKWEPNSKELMSIEDMAKRGVTYKSIAGVMGISLRTFHDAKDRLPILQETLDRARSHGENLATGYLFKILENQDHKNHFAAICFYLKTQHQWREVNRVEVDNNPAPTNEFNGYEIIVKKKDEEVEEVSGPVEE